MKTEKKKPFSTNVVCGEDFIGRVNYKNYLLEYVFDYIIQGYPKRCSITGMHRIGKSSLVKEVCHYISGDDCIIGDETKKIYVRNTTLQSRDSFWAFWLYEVIRPILDDKNVNKWIKDNTKEASNGWSDLSKFFYDDKVEERLYDDNRSHNMALTNVDKFFTQLKHAGIMLVLIIDEFDEASKIFKDYLGILRTWFVNSNYGLSVILISRLSLEAICSGDNAGNQSGSPFPGIFDIRRSLFGYSNSEYQLFIDEIEKRAGIHLTETQLKKIWYYAGRSPFYLAIMGNDAINNGDKFDPDLVFNSNGSILASYDKIIGRLKEEKLLTAMLQVFVGPQKGLDKSELTKLISHGYCKSRVDLEKENLGDEFCDVINHDFKPDYITICDAFIEYLSETCDKERSEIWNEYSEVVKLFRKIIAEDFKQRSGLISWRSKIKEYCKNKNINQIEKFEITHSELIAKATQNQRDEVGDSYLNLLNINQLAQIMTEDNMWERYSKYFYVKNIKDFQEKVGLLKRARDPYAHQNDGLLSLDEVREVDKICIDFINSINKILS